MWVLSRLWQMAGLKRWKVRMHIWHLVNTIEIYQLGFFDDHDDYKLRPRCLQPHTSSQPLDRAPPFLALDTVVAPDDSGTVTPTAPYPPSHSYP